MKQIRCGAFETNSSSTHCLTLMTADEFERWKLDEYRWDDVNEVMITDKSDFNDFDDDQITFEEANFLEDFDYRDVTMKDGGQYVVVSFTIDNH